jgi:hypothetical protein
VRGVKSLEDYNKRAELARLSAVSKEKAEKAAAAAEEERARAAAARPPPPPPPAPAPRPESWEAMAHARAEAGRAAEAVRAAERAAKEAKDKAAAEKKAADRAAHEKVLERELPEKVERGEWHLYTADDAFPAPEWRDNTHTRERWAVTGLVNQKQYKTAADFFRLFFDEEVLDFIVHHTNNALQKAGDDEDVDGDTVLAVLGTTLLMGRARMGVVHDYWHNTYGYPPVKEVWARDRFLRVWRALSICTDGRVEYAAASAAEQALTDRIPEIVDFAQMMNRKFAAQIKLGQDAIVDETMCPFRGNNDAVMHQPNKPVRIGFKLYTLTTRDGYVITTVPYAGALDDDKLAEGASQLIVLKLVAPFLRGGACYLPGRIVVIDKFYSALPLTMRLLSEGLFVVGTIRPDRAGYPSALLAGEPGRGLVKVAVHNDTPGLSITVWNDSISYEKNKVNQYISTCAPLPMGWVSKKRSKKDVHVRLPVVVDMYNQRMGGVDRANRKVADIDVYMKTPRQWLPLFMHYFSVAVSNAHYLCKRYGVRDVRSKYPTLRSFTDALAEELTKGFGGGRSKNVPKRPYDGGGELLQRDAGPDGRKPRIRCQARTGLQTNNKPRACGKLTTFYCSLCSTDSQFIGVCGAHGSDTSCWVWHVQNMH